MEYTAYPNSNPEIQTKTAPWPTTPRPAAAPAQPLRSWPVSPQPAAPARVYTGQGAQDPSCIIRGLAKELVDVRDIQLNGEIVSTAILLLETSPGRIVPISVWGQKKLEFVQQGIGKVCDIIFTLGCQTRQVPLKETGELTTIYNVSCKLKSCLWV